MLVYQRTTRDPQGPFESVAVVLTLFMSGRRGIGRANPAPLAVLLAYALAACALISGGSSVFGVALSWVLLAVLPMAAGATVARRGELTRDLADTAARLKDEQEMRAARAAGEERNRVARDLHDVVAHSVSVMVIQAGAARRGRRDADPSRGPALRSGWSRRPDGRRWRTFAAFYGRAASAATTRSPAPPVGLAQLNGLIDRIRVGGSAHGASRRGTAPARCLRCGPGFRLPGRPGGADQRGQARRSLLRAGTSELRSPRARPARDRHRDWTDQRAPAAHQARSRARRHA